MSIRRVLFKLQEEMTDTDFRCHRVIKGEKPCIEEIPDVENACAACQAVTSWMFKIDKAGGFK